MNSSRVVWLTVLAAADSERSALDQRQCEERLVSLLQSVVPHVRCHHAYHLNVPDRDESLLERASQRVVQHTLILLGEDSRK